jgi:hypothetical protein
LCRANLSIKRASASRPSRQWNDDNFDVLAGGEMQMVAAAGRAPASHLNALAYPTAPQSPSGRKSEFSTLPNKIRSALRGNGAQRFAQAGEREHCLDTTVSTAATTAAPSSPLLSAYDGQRCIGFVCSRGKLGFEAFDSRERSLGVYATRREAAAAIMRGSP